MTPPVTPHLDSHGAGRAPADLPILYTTEEAADILRVRAGWLERQAAARKIPFTLLGGCYRFTVRHLNDIVRIFEPEPNAGGATSTAREPASRRSNSTTSMTSPLRARPRAQAA